MAKPNLTLTGSNVGSAGLGSQDIGSGSSIDVICINPGC